MRVSRVHVTMESMNTSRPELGFLLSMLLLIPAAARAQTPTKTVDFDLDIKPLLSDRCFVCHGPDAVQRSTHLRLDTREGLFAAIDGMFGQHTVAAGKPQESELFGRITTDD